MAEEAPPGPKGLSVDMPPTEEGGCHMAPFPVGSIKSRASRGMLQQKRVCVGGKKPSKWYARMLSPDVPRSSPPETKRGKRSKLPTSFSQESDRTKRTKTKAREDEEKATELRGLVGYQPDPGEAKPFP